MIRTAGRFELKLISADALASYMKTRDFSVRTLAEACGDPKYRSTIGHLRSGERDQCHPDLAKRIERVLNAPKGSLFIPSISRVSREVPPARIRQPRRERVAVNQ